MNITLFGGAFNPPHLGHSLVIQQAFELIPKIDQLWLVPDYQHTFSKNSGLAPVSHRLQMTQLLLDSLPKPLVDKVKLCPINIDNKTTGNTWDTLNLLKSKQKPANYSFLMGSDNLESFKKWGNWEKLIKALPFYVYPRAGYSGKINFPNMTLLESDTQIITNISSTNIRKRLQNKLSVSQLLSPKILSYIRVKKLY